MGLFDGLKNLGKAAIGTALLPVDVLRDVGSAIADPLDGDVGHTGRRLNKIGRNASDALDEIDED